MVCYVHLFLFFSINLKIVLCRLCFVYSFLMLAQKIAYNYVLPDAVTRFRQGLGRLIRGEQDKGIIVSFDDRLVRSNYKQFFEQALENYKQNKGNFIILILLLRENNIIFKFR